VHIDTTKTSFKIVDNIGSCYLTVKLINNEGGGIKDEKAYGEVSGGALAPTISATLGRRYKLSHENVPSVCVSLKRKGGLSHATVGRGEFDLENDVMDVLEKRADDAFKLGEAAKAAEAQAALLAAAAQDAVVAAAAAAQAEAETQVEASKAAEAASAEAAAVKGGDDMYLAPSAGEVLAADLSDVEVAAAAAAAAAAVMAAKTSGSAAAVAAAAVTASGKAGGVGGAGGEGGGRPNLSYDSLTRAVAGTGAAAEAQRAAGEAAAAAKAARAAADAAEKLSDEAVTVVVDIMAGKEKEGAGRTSMSMFRGSQSGGGGGGGVGGGAGRSGQYSVGTVTMAVYFSGGGEEEKKRDGGPAAGERAGGGRLSLVGEGEDDDDDGGGGGGGPAKLDPLDLPKGCPRLEERKNDFMGPTADGGEYGPNEVEAVAVRGIKLRGPEKKADTWLRLRIVESKVSAQTAVVRDTTNPSWHHRMAVKAPDPTHTCEFTVYQYNKWPAPVSTETSAFFGRAFVKLKILADKKPQRLVLELKNKKGENEGEPYGSVEVVLRWRFNEKLPLNLDVVEAGKAKARRAAKGDDGDSDDNNDDVEESAEDKAKAAEDKAAALQNAENSCTVVSGDYMVYVHVIEARELKAKDAGGTSDPVVFVEAFGQKGHTQVVPKTLSPVFDDSFSLSVRALDVDDFKEGVVTLSVADSNSVLRNELIGSCVLDASFIYQQPNHELWQQWVGLLNTKDPSDDGIQGYLKFSVSIVGPNDRLIMHKDDEVYTHECHTYTAGLRALVPSLRVSRGPFGTRVTPPTN